MIILHLFRNLRNHLQSLKIPLSPPFSKGEAKLLFSLLVAFAIFSTTFAHAAPNDDAVFKRKPEAIIDLGTKEGAQQVKGQWRYSDTKIIEVDFKAVGSDGQPSKTPNKTYDITPQAGGANFDDSKWEVIEATTLGKRRTNGKLAFNWYRIKITVPERIGDFNPAGSTAVFTTSLDDYAEIWVDGELPRAAGQSGGSVIKGWNAKNKLVVGRGVKPGQTIQLAIFGANGPLSQPPTNYIWMRHARLEFHKVPHTPFAVTPHEVNVNVERVDPAIDAIVPLTRKFLSSPKVFSSPRDRSGPRAAIFSSATPTPI